MAFIDIRMPERLINDVQGGPEFDNTVSRTPAGFEQINKNRMDAIWRWQIGNFLKDQDQRLQMLAFHLAVAGNADSFRFRDPLHWFHNQTVVDGVLTDLAPANMVAFETGDGVTTVFQLQVPFPYTGATTYYAIITKPVVGKFKLYKGTTLQATPADYTMNYTTGAITMTSPVANGTVLRWAGEFDRQARFVDQHLKLASSDSPFVTTMQGIGVIEVNEP